MKFTVPCHWPLALVIASDLPLVVKPVLRGIVWVTFTAPAACR